MIHLDISHDQVSGILLNLVLVGYFGLELAVIAYVIYLI
jgi:hypothetical protein